MSSGNAIYKNQKKVRMKMERIILSILAVLCVLPLYALMIPTVLITPNLQENPHLTFIHVATTPITQEQYATVMGSNPSHFVGADLPVEMVSWYEAIAFCNRLSAMHGLEPVYIYFAHNANIAWDEDYIGTRDVEEWIVPFRGIPNFRVRQWNMIVADEKANGYRLLTRAESDYIYSRTATDVLGNIETYAWIAENSDGKTHTVASKSPDSFGLYDFHGNVLEWTFEHTGIIPDSFFRHFSAEQEMRFRTRAFRVFTEREFVITRTDQGLIPVVKNNAIGFRVVRNAM
jgi:formylglycine-generating enzyme required for sulfatase activity